MSDNANLVGLFVSYSPSETIELLFCFNRHQEDYCFECSWKHHQIQLDNVWTLSQLSWKTTSETLDKRQWTAVSQFAVRTPSGYSRRCPRILWTTFLYNPTLDVDALMHSYDKRGKFTVFLLQLTIRDTCVKVNMSRSSVVDKIQPVPVTAYQYYDGGGITISLYQISAVCSES